MGSSREARAPSLLMQYHLLTNKATRTTALLAALVDTSSLRKADMVAATVVVTIKAQLAEGSGVREVETLAGNCSSNSLGLYCVD